MSRVWAMPSHETFRIKPIAALIARYVGPGSKVLDPFARNSALATMTNDLNPRTSAMHHLDAVAFLDEMLVLGVRFNVTLFDPPYSPHQVKEMYQNFGRKVTQADTQMSVIKQCRDRSDLLLEPGGLVINCGWDSNGMGIGRGYELLEVLLVAHGGTRHDTIVTVERKKAFPPSA
jgi:hypothetical protein